MTIEENLTPQYRIEEYLEAIVSGWVDATMASYPDYPSWRIEEFLDAFITYIWEDGDHPRHPCPEPVWRIEECLRAIYDVLTGAATPWAFPLPATTRIEEYLAAIHAYLTDSTELPVPEPVWRIEQWLAYVLDAVKHGGDVTKTVSGTMVHITDALAKAALSVLVDIDPVQAGSGDPSPDNVRPITGWTGVNVYVSPTQDQQDATTYAVDWTSEAGTVYGGTLDVTNGVLTVDRASVDLTTGMAEGVAGSGYVFYKSLENAKTVPNSQIAPVSSEAYVAIRFNAISSSVKHISIRDNGAIYVNTGSADVQPIGKAVYELATPITYQLTPQEVQMLLGENYVWSSSGDTVSVTYYAEGNANPLQSLNILLGGNYSNPKTADDVSDKEALEIILGGNK